MKSASRGILVVLILAPLGLWGCGQDKNANNTGKIRDLAVRNSKLEEDCKVAANAGDNLRKKLKETEAARAELAQQVEQLKDAIRERDELQKQVVSRTSERDALHAQLALFGKELQTLAGRIETAATLRGQPSTTVPTALTHE
jgi:chromosome segregation ATPase